jgi:hypothetical protein
MSDSDKSTRKAWWLFDECRPCTIARLLALGAILGAGVVSIFFLVT